MTDRYKGFLVTLTNNTRSDDAEPILDAIRMIRGVATVKPITADANDQCVRDRVLEDLRKEIIPLLYWPREK